MNLSIEYGDNLRAAIHEVESFGNPFCRLNIAIANVAGLLVPYPETARIAMFGAFTPQAMGPDVTRGTAQLFHQISSNLKLLLHIGLCRTAAMLEDIIDGLNTSRYLQVCLTCRALMEHLAIAQARYRRMCPLLIELENVKPSDVRRVLSGKNSATDLFTSILPVIEELDRWYSAGRFNFGTLKSNPDFLPELAKDSRKRQIGIGDAIEDLAWSGALLPSTTPSFYYSLLCDYVHPNCGANWLFIDKQETTTVRHRLSPVDVPVYSSVSSKRPSDTSLQLHVLQLCYIPLRESLNAYADHLQWLSAVTRKRAAFNQSLWDMGIRPIIKDSLEL